MMAAVAADPSGLVTNSGSSSSSSISGLGGVGGGGSRTPGPGGVAAGIVAGPRAAGFLGGAVCACRNPLPRCAVCLLHMRAPAENAQFAAPPRAASGSEPGSMDGAAAGSDGIAIGGGGELSGTDAWFAWCQACRHGGHAGHLRAWFASQAGWRDGAAATCPVTGCECRCVAASGGWPGAFGALAVS
ncbi:hypothetical protein HK405_003852 [Cladochytrium tenue]|nr:hypothetical protein HK405_003852 [Cladochytrium tenue]